MRVAVIGIGGSGKTTFAGRLAAQLGVPHVQLDSLPRSNSLRSKAHERRRVFLPRRVKRALLCHRKEGNGISRNVRIYRDKCQLML
jgi:broad-specificity NMP kinase